MLDLTPKEISERSALRINPCKTVSLSARSTARSACILHAAQPWLQGCASYHRTFLSRHFKGLQSHRRVPLRKVRRCSAAAAT